MKPVLTVRNLTMEVKEGPDFRDLSFEIGHGEAVALTSVGPANLRGLLEVLTGLSCPAKGSVNWNRLAPLCTPSEWKEPVQSRYRTTRGIRLTNAYVSASVALLNHLTIFENVALPLRYHFSPPEKLVQERTERLMELLRLLDVADEHPTGLPHGVNLRAALARALILEPTILFLDSPLAEVDNESSGILFAVLKHFLKKVGLTVLATSYEPLSLLPLVSRVLVLYDGRLTEILEGDALNRNEFLERMNRFYEEFYNRRTQLDAHPS